MIPRPPRSTRTDSLSPYTTLFRSNHRHGIFARRGGVARTIGKEYASRLLRHDIFKAGGSRKDCHLCARTNKIAEDVTRSEEHTSELQSLMRISYSVF